MVPDLKDRPGSQYSDTPPDISSGVQDAENFANDPSNSSQSIAERELNATSRDGNSTATSSNEPKSEDSGIKNSTTSEPPPKGFIGKLKQKQKQAIATGAAIGVTTALVGVVLTAPFAIMNHLSNMLTGKVGDVEISHQLRYNKKAFSRLKDRFTINGWRGGTIVADMQRKGYTFQFDGDKIVAVKRPGATSFSTSADEIGAHFSEHMESKARLFKRRWKTNGAEALYKKFGVQRGSILTALPKNADVPANQQISQDLRRAADSGNADLEFNPRSPPDGEPADGEPTADEIEAGNNGSRPLVDDSGIFSEAEQWLDEGKPASEFPDQRVMQALISPDVSQVSVDLAGDIIDGRSVASSLGSTVKGVGLSTDILDKVCTLNRALKAAVTVARVYRSISLMAVTFRYISADDGIKKQEASSDLMAEILKRLMTKGATGGYFGSSAGYDLAMNGSFSKSKNNLRKAGTAVDGSPGGWQGETLKTTDKIPGCSIWTNGFAQVGLAVIEIGLTVISFGGAKAATTAAATGVREAIEKGVIKTVSTIIRSRIARGIAQGLVIDLSIDKIITLAKLETEKTLKGNISGQEVGEDLSAQLFAGGAVATGLQSAQAGLPPATPEVFEDAVLALKKEKQEDLKNTSIFARFFDFSNPDSLAFNKFSDLAFSGALDPNNTPSNISNLAFAPINSFASLASLATPKTTAQDSDLVTHEVYTTEGDINSGVEIATDPSGVLRRAQRADIEAIDVDENIAILSGNSYGGPNIETLPNGDYKILSGSTLDTFIVDCIENIDVISAIEAGKDCMANEESSKRFYRFLQEQNFLENDLGAYEHPEAIGISGSVSNSNNQGPGVTNNNYALTSGTAIPGGNTSDTQCPISATIQNIGIETEAYLGGVRYTIRLCAVHGVRVNSVIAKQVDDLFNSMKTSGFTISGSAGFRDMAGQIRGFANGAGSGTFARPGYSNHQFGTAIDVSCQGGGQSYTAGTGRGRDEFIAGVSAYPCLDYVAKNSNNFGLLLQCIGENGGAGGEIAANKGGCEWWHLSPTGG